jgi:hypothetical protein
VSTLRAVVSVSKLSTFCASKGISAELSGAMFGTTIKLQKLNEQAEVKAMKNLCETLKQILEKSFDYSIKVMGDPVNPGNDKREWPYHISTFKEGIETSDLWAIPVKVEIYKNSNFEIFVDYLYKTLPQLGMSSPEVSDYMKLKKSFYQVALFDGTQATLNTWRIPVQKISEAPHFTSEQKYDYWLRKQIESSDSFKNQYGSHFMQKVPYNKKDELIELISKIQRTESLNYKYRPRYLYVTSSPDLYNRIFLRTKEARDIFIILISDIGSIARDRRIYYTTSDTLRIVRESLLESQLYNFHCAVKMNTNMQLTVPNLFKDPEYTTDSKLYAENNLIPQYLEKQWETIWDKGANSLLKNANWEKKIWFPGKDNTGEPNSAWPIESYFGLLYPNFSKYANLVDLYAGMVPGFSSNPFQFKLIGDHNNCVSATDFHIIVDTETLSGITGFKIDK